MSAIYHSTLFLVNQEDYPLLPSITLILIIRVHTTSFALAVIVVILFLLHILVANFSTWLLAQVVSKPSVQ